MTETGSPTGLGALLNRAEIEQLCRTYLRGLDRRDAALLRAVFHDDATTHYGAFTGSPDEFTVMAIKWLSTHEADQHLLGQINLWFAPDRPDEATGEVYFQAFHRIADPLGARTDLVVGGRFVDRYARREGRWAITHRTEVVDWARTEPTADDYLPTRPYTIVGQPGPDDLSYRIGDA